PVQLHAIPDFSFAEEMSLNISNFFTDPDQDNLSVSLEPNPYIRLKQRNEKITFFSTGFPGRYHLSLRVSDSTSEIGSNPFTITILNTSEDLLNHTILQGPVEFGAPVVWTQVITVQNTEETTLEKQIVVDLPKAARQLEFSERGRNLSFGQEALSISAVLEESILYFFSDTFTPGEIKSFFFTYETLGPIKEETNVSAYTKIITISSETNYTNFTAYTDIGGYPEKAIHLYWLSERGKILVENVTYVDYENDSLVDRIEWTVPHLSNRSYELDIVILNVQSYPQVGGTWTVRFETIGEANLTITASNGTTYNMTPNDLTPLELTCNGTILDYAWLNASAVSYPHYSCTGTGSWTVQVNTQGSHHQEFTFGGVQAWAHNLASSGMNKNLSTASNASFLGYKGGDWAGYSVAGVGDVNGDGFDDFVVGAPGDVQGGNANQGAAYLVLGGQAVSMNSNLSTLANGSYVGESAGDLLGFSAAGIGDVNKDGFDDFVVGAPGNKECCGTSPGQVYLVFGGQAWGLNRNISVWSNGSFWGGDSADQAGFSVAGVGDVNGDIFSDFLIGAPNEQGGGTSRGQTYLVLGGQAWSMHMSVNNSNGSYTGAVNADLSGSRVAGVGDVNKDGFDDFLIGTYMWGAAITADKGMTYLILGGQAWATGRLLTTTANASYVGEDTYDYLGWDVAGVGDVNSDGFDDFIMGAFRDEVPTAEYAGQAYLILGGQAWGMNRNAGTTGNASYWGETGNDNSSRSIAGVGDINGDGFDDFVIGAPNDEEGSQQGAGQAYLVLGGQGWVMDRNLSNESNSSFWGEDGTDFASAGIAGIGDFDKDSAYDFVIGAPGDEQGSGNATGQTYVLFGDRKTPPQSVMSIDVKSDSTYSSSANTINVSSTIYVQLSGTDGDPLVVDSILLNASTTSDTRGIEFLAVETAVNSGTYRGTFYLRNTSANRQFKKLFGFSGDTLTISLLNGSAVSENIYISDACFQVNETLVVSSVISCADSVIRVTNLTINSGGKLFLNGSNLTVDGPTLV
ncbi:MAG: integrin alpha, partial [Nanoarchaeota archaeon]